MSRSRSPLGPTRVDAGQRAGHRVESGSEDQHIAGIGRFVGSYSAGGDRVDGLTAQVHQPHVVAIESGVIAGVGTDPFRPDRMIDRDEVGGDNGIGHDFADPLFGELPGDVVGRQVAVLVGKRLGEKDTALAPALPQGVNAFLRVRRRPRFCG